MAGVLFGAWPTASHQNSNFSDTFKVNGTVVSANRQNSNHPDVNGGIWKYVNCTATVTEGAWVTIDELGAAILISDAVADLGDVGVMGGAVTADDYGWAQVYGNCTLAQSESTLASDAPLFADTLAGEVDDAVITQRLIHGAFSRSAASTSHTAATTAIDAQLQYPMFNTLIGDTAASAG